MCELNQDLITFGKYKNKNISEALKDRNYCYWLLQQEWVKNNYEYIYNKINEYDPQIYFINPYIGENSDDFVEYYKFFLLTPITDLKINLSEEEKCCYSFYFNLVKDIKSKIQENRNKQIENIYNIKAPTKWLQRFESETKLERVKFKNFIKSYELPNIPSIIQDIKSQGGIEYKGAISYNIAKERSKKQENYWEKLLKEKYDEDIGSQFKFEKCIFDFIHINKSYIFECKLNLKDFNENQYSKYLKTLNNYKIKYLIGIDTIIDIENRKIITLDTTEYLKSMKLCKDDNKLLTICQDFDLIEIQDNLIEFL